MKLCLNFDHYREIAELKGTNAALEQERNLLRARLDMLEDWLLKINGAPGLDRDMPAKPARETLIPTIPTEPAPHWQNATGREPDPEPRPTNPFAGARNMSEWSRIAERLESESFGSIDPAFKHVAAK